METTTGSFESSKAKQAKKRKRNKLIITIIVILLVAAIVATVGIKVLSGAGEDSDSVLTYQVGSVSQGEVETSVSGSGTLTPISSESVTAGAAATVLTVDKKTGDTVAAGDVIMTLESSEIDEQLDTLETELSQINSRLASSDQEASSLYVTAGAAGEVKGIVAAEGDVVDGKSYLCYISTDGKMRVSVTGETEVAKYSAVTVKVGDDEVDGVVMAVNGKTFEAVIDDNSYEIGTEATVYDASGAQLGTGKLELNEYAIVTGSYGVIDSILVDENDTVSRTSKLFELEDGAPSSSYMSLREQKEDLLDQIADLEAQKTITADYDGSVASISAAAGNEVAAGDALCTLTGSSGYTLSLSVDEMDIDSVSIGQTATITLDAIDGTFEGEVTNISYEGSTSGSVTTYSVTVKVDYIDGSHAGMSASAEIVTESSGDTLMVPVDAVQYEGETAYIYLAPDDASVGASYASDEINTADLTKVTVTTGMSDGSYIAVSGDGLEKGTLIIIPTLTTTSSPDDEQETQTINMGGMMGGGMQSGEMPSFGGSNSSSGSGGGTRPDWSSGGTNAQSGGN
jgi:multidrug efflux pump subunit AcrA (membrane-fusion protein)